MSTKDHDLTAAFLKFADELSQFKREELPLSKPATSEEIKNHLSQFTFEKPVESKSLVDNVLNMMQDWTLHSTNPRYFGLFNPTTPISSTMADAAVAFFNPQLAVWWHAPGAVEIEQHTLNYLGQKLGFNPKTMFSSFTSGGSESNMTAMLMAIAEQCPDYIHHGLRSLLSPPTIYISKTAHHSFIKVVKNIGMGLDHMRLIDVDENNRMDMKALEKQLELDEAAGFIPTVVVGTAGTTSMGIIDPLEEISKVCEEWGLWFHVDGAWGGACAMSGKNRDVLNGVEKADSITIDAHKWFSVPFGAGMLFTKNSGDLAEDVFGISADYVPKGRFETHHTVNYYTSTLQWSRRFMGLKLFMLFAEMGEQGMADRIDNMFDLGDYMRDKFVEGPWTLHNDTRLPIICVTNKSIDDGILTTAEILAEIYRRNEFWISDIEMMNNGKKALRICITHYETTKEDIDFMYVALQEIIDDLLKAKQA